MGRILKKKDPAKKRALRVEKSNQEVNASANGSNSMPKPLAAAKKSPTQAKPKVTGPDSSLPQKVMQFLREVKIELKKVTWPTRKQTMGSTIVVIVLVVIISAFLGVVDFGLSSLIRVVLP